VVWAALATVGFLVLAVVARRWVARRGPRAAAVAAACACAFACGSYGAARAYANIRGTPEPQPPRELGPGVVYERRVDPSAPRVEHWVKVDLGRGDLEVVFSRGDDGDLPLVGATTSEFAVDEGAIVATNGGFFEPWEPGLIDPYPKRGERVAPVGIGASDGRVFGEADPRVRTLFVAGDGSLGFERPEKIVAAMSGGCMLVERGRPRSSGGCELMKVNDKPQPRTALGLSADRQTLWLLVVDGRQARYSAGATLDELSALFVAEGAADAINLDGGGSSVVVEGGDRGHPEILSAPISAGIVGHERVVGTHVGVRRKKE